MAPIDPERLAELVSELVNSLQSAVLLGSRLEPDLRQSSRDAGELRAAIERAAVAAKQLRPNGEEA